MKLNFKKFGEGEKNLIIIHGLLGTLDNWQYHAKLLSQQCTVYCIDVRNHGKSPHADSHTFNDLSIDLQQFFHQHAIHKASVLGHSMGGKMAMQFANDAPHLVEKLIVADITPFAYKPHHQRVFNALLAVDLSLITDRKQVEEILLDKLQNEEETQFLLKSLYRTETGFNWRFNLAVLHAFYNEIIGNVRIDFPIYLPTMFISGALSNYVTHEDEKMIHDLFPMAVFETVSQARHWLHVDNPTEFLEKVTYFLD